MKRKPNKYNLQTEKATDRRLKKSKYRRSRLRAENPQQSYVYATQRTTEAQDDNLSLSLARELGMILSTQHCDPLVDGVEPRIVGQIRVSDDAGSGAYAYLIDKPAGWAIVGSSKSVNSHKKREVNDLVAIDEEDSGLPEISSDDLERLKSKFVTQVQIEDEADGSIEIFKYNELDVLALMKPEELEEYREDGGDEELLALLQAFQSAPLQAQSSPSLFDGVETDEMNAYGPRAENLRRIAARQARMSGKACFAEWVRPSIVAWLKDVKAQEGTPIRGGKFWTALAGATEVDDTGLVLLTPKASVENIFVDYAAYLAVVGNGERTTPTGNAKESGKIPAELVQVNLKSNLKTARELDTVTTVRVVVRETPSSCSAVIPICEDKFRNGIRGDPVPEPFDRRAPRRLLHCAGLSVSSLLFDETAQTELESVPDDIALYLNRGNQKYVHGSFLGRQNLEENPKTNCYREINGAADGYPGWVVDRYDKWLYVQHDPDYPRGPLPSIHDGNTAGVYYLARKLDRSQMGSSGDGHPHLLEGMSAPEHFEVIENGVKYVVSLEKDLSTGIFLDQRPQRAWLTKHCSEDTSVLNCFAHTGAFSIAAAMTGAHTVSVDLSSYWMGRFPEHLAANGIEFDDRHDCITGDCFDWLVRLAKRGEKYDIVIVDPPSTSVGRKKRWSIKNNMDELVSLSASLVKDGGLLWTTTNSASVSSVKFARLCKKGLEMAGKGDAKLERLQPMPTDFLSVGPSPVKNFVWRIS